VEGVASNAAFAELAILKYYVTEAATECHTQANGTFESSISAVPMDGPVRFDYKTTETARLSAEVYGQK